MRTEENEIGLFDLLLVIAENLKLLILGPLVVGGVVLGIGYALPQCFVSHAILNIKAADQAAALMTSSVIWDPVIKSLDLARERSAEEARSALSRQIKVVVGKDGFLRLDVVARQPKEAQVIANAIIDAWLKTTVPGPQVRADLEKRLAYAKDALASTSSLRRVIVEDAMRDDAGNQVSSSLRKQPRNDFSRDIAAVSELQQHYFEQVLSIPQALQGVSREVIVQVPTLATEPEESKRSLMAVLLGIVSGLFLLVWIFIRQAWRNAARYPDIAAKQAKLRSTFGFR